MIRTENRYGNGSFWNKGLLILAGMLAGIAISRLLYEGVFPTMAWAGRPLGVFICATVGGGLAFALHKSISWSYTLPFWFNLVWLMDSTVDLVSSRLIFFGTLWLVGYATAVYKTQSPHDKWWQRPWFWIMLALVPLYALTLGRTVGTNDTFEFQVVIPQLGIVHATGYPLYLLLGKLWTLLIPFGSVAWRINVGTAVYAIATAILLCQLILYIIPHLPSVKKINPTHHQTVAIFTACIFALTPTFWSQAAAAEVYTLHNLIIVIGLHLILALLNNPKTGRWLAFLLGLGLTNHLTTVFLVPATAFAYLTNQTTSFKAKIQEFRWLIPLAFAPLALYAYLPLRWQAVNNEPMGLSRFIGWVTGNQFQGALQWWAWLRDPTRYEVVGRLFLADWPLYLLALTAVGFLWLLYVNWRIGVLFLLTWLGFTFYCLNYYVPDLNVFLLPAQLLLAVWLGVGLLAIIRIPWLDKLPSAWPTLLFLLLLPLLPARYTAVDNSQNDGLVTWGMGVLQQDLAENSVILADSEKIAPLYYLQQAEGIRPDLDIKVLFTEAEYRQVLDSRIAAGDVVYLARFLPQLAGQYHLRSVGPLTEVSQQPLKTMPSNASPTQLDFGDIQLVGVALETYAAVDPQSTAVTLYWTADQATDQALQIYVRWAGHIPINPTGTHPANDDYPTVAWRDGEVVPDFHLLPIPNLPPEQLEIEIAVAPAFTPTSDLAWQAVTTADLTDYQPPATIQNGRPIRALFGDGAALTQIAFPTQIRPQADFTAAKSGTNADLVAVNLEPKLIDGQIEIEGELPRGQYEVVARQEGKTAVCGWLQPAAEQCVLGSVQVSGVSLPDGATNFADLIALRQINIANNQTTLQPGSELVLDIEWQALGAINDDYTVFVQVLTEDDQLVGQIDSWPLQGTLPTSSWEVGQIVTDPYRVPLAADLPSGNYRLIVGFYRLADLQRLSVVDELGQPLNDKYEITGLIVP